ncbi:MAG: AzlD domain-containing protein [Sphaerochaetaceae bacterium]
MSHNIPYFVYILASAVATILVRAIPYYASFLNHLPPFLNKCLRLLPIAALGALICPGAFWDFNPTWYAGVMGVGVAYILAWFKMPMIIPIIASIFVTYLGLVL